MIFEDELKYLDKVEERRILIESKVNQIELLYSNALPNDIINSETKIVDGRQITITRYKSSHESYGEEIRQLITDIQKLENN